MSVKADLIEEKTVFVVEDCTPTSSGEPEGYSEAESQGASPKPTVVQSLGYLGLGGQRAGLIRVASPRVPRWGRD